MAGKRGRPKANGDSASEPNVLDIYVGQRVREMRLMRGLSQTQLGESLGVTFQQVQKYENGKNRISASRLFDIAQVLNVAVAYFFQGIENHAPKHPAAGMAEGGPAFEEEHMRRETLELVRTYFRITNPAVRRRYLDLIRSLSSE